MAQEVLSQANEGHQRGVAGDLDLEAYDHEIYGVVEKPV